MARANRPGLVLALSGGGAAGLAHIGVLQELAEHAIPVRAIVGTSIGAEIGAFAASGMPLDELAALATAFDWKQTLQLFVPDLPTGGLVSGRKIVDFLNARLGPHRIEDLPVGFAAVATDVESGEPVVLDRGSLVEAVRASISIPGLMAPHALDGRRLVDGGVLNPVPFDVARAHFGAPVVAVMVQASARRKPGARVARSRQWPARVRQLLEQPWSARAPGLRAWLKAQLEGYERRQANRNYWTAARVLDRALDIAQAEMVRLRMREHPPELVLAPEVGDIGVLEFYRGREAIAAGRAAVRAQLAALKRLPGAAG